MPTNLDYETFKENIFDYENEQEWKYKGDKPAILDFYADWCNPCKMTEPILEKLDKENDDIEIYKIDTDQYPYLAGIFGISSIPTFMFIPLDGDLRMANGALTEESFNNAIDVYLRKSKSEEEIANSSTTEENTQNQQAGLNEEPNSEPDSTQVGESSLYTPGNSKSGSSLVDKDGNPLR